MNLSKLNSKSLLKTSLKLGFSVGALVFIFQHLQIDALLKHITVLSPLVLLSCFCILAISQYIGGMRLHFYCTQNDIQVERKNSVILYFIGLFFNNLLPGGVGGDGYVAIMLKHIYQAPIKLSIRILISARANGMLLLILISGGLAYFSQTLAETMHGYTMLYILLALTLCCYTLAARYMLFEKYSTQLMACAYSLIIQGSIAYIFYLLLDAIGVEQHLTFDYLTLLMLSNILVIIPISFGGLGLRELGFLYSSQLVGLNPEIGVAITLLFYTFSLLLSLVGLALFASKKQQKTSAQAS